MKWLSMLAVVGALAALHPGTAAAEVLDSAANGFTVRSEAVLAAPPQEAWTALTAGFGQWWDSAHSFYGDASRFRLDPTVGGAWIEDQGDGRWVKHLEVVYADPGRQLRLRGGLGPLQGMGVSGALTIELAPADEGTDAVLTYAVGGYAPEGLDFLAPVVDAVLAEQLQRLQEYLAR